MKVPLKSRIRIYWTTALIASCILLTSCARCAWKDYPEFVLEEGLSALAFRYPPAYEPDTVVVNNDSHISNTTYIFFSFASDASYPSLICIILHGCDQQENSGYIAEQDTESDKYTLISNVPITLDNVKGERRLYSYTETPEAGTPVPMRVIEVFAQNERVECEIEISFPESIPEDTFNCIFDTLRLRKLIN